MVSRTQNRGQLLLLGGLAIAIVLLVAIPLANSLVVTQSASTSETVTSIDTVSREEAAINRSVETIVDRVDTVDELRWALQNYSATNTRVRGSSSAAYVNVTFNSVDSVGNVHFRADDDFGRPSDTTGSNDWQVMGNADSIGAFNLTIDDAQATATPSAAAFTVTITDDSGDRWRLRAYRLSPGGPVTIETQEGTDPWQTACTGSAPVEVDIERGTCSYDDTTNTFPSHYTDTLEPQYEVRFDKGNNMNDQGDFRLTGDGDFQSSSEVDSFPAVPAIDISYVGPDASYNRTIVMEDGL